MISQDSPEDCREIVQELGLQVPVVSVDSTFYDRFRVRVMPFTFFLDPDGIIRRVGPIGNEEQLMLAWRMAQAARKAGDSMNKAV